MASIMFMLVLLGVLLSAFSSSISWIWRAGLLESELCVGGFLVNIVVGVNDQVFCFGHVGLFVAVGRVHLDNEGFAISCVLEECDALDAGLLFAPAYGFRVDVADVVCGL